MKHGRRKRIVLYNPQQADRAKGVPYSKDVLPLALLSIASWPVADGYEVVLIDGELHSQDEAHRRVLEACEGALLFATTGILGYQVTDGWLCARAVNARHPDLPLFIGGWFASVAPELQLATGLYAAVAIGQGEVTFRELVQAVAAGTSLEAVAGLALLRDGEVVRTAPRHAVGWEHIADTPWHLIDFAPYRDQQLAQRGAFQWEAAPTPPDAKTGARPWTGISYFASFGCPLQCTFCCSPEVSGLRWKAMPAERMLDDLYALHDRWGFDVVRFFDANYGVTEERVRAFADGVLERGRRFWHYAYLQSSSIVRYKGETLDHLAAAGMYQVLLGGETGTQATMRAIKKTTREGDNLAAAQRLCARGIVPQLTYVIGYPDECEASMMATLEEVRQVQVACPASNPTVWPFKPIPGTPMFEEAVARGYQPPATLAEWGDMGDYRHETEWQGRISPSVTRRQRLFNHFAVVARGSVRGKIGFWERRARRRLATGDFRFGRLEAKAFDLLY